MLACVECVFIHNRNLLFDVDYRLSFRPLSLEKRGFLPLWKQNLMFCVYARDGWNQTEDHVCILSAFKVITMS